MLQRRHLLFFSLPLRPPFRRPLRLLLPLISPPFVCPASRADIEPFVVVEPVKRRLPAITTPHHLHLSLLYFTFCDFLKIDLGLFLKCGKFSL